MRKIPVSIAILAYCLHFTSMHGQVIFIPTDQPTIQEGIDNASDGDTVLVSPGKYVENINFKGKDIVLTSLFPSSGDSSYIYQTTIDGNKEAPTVVFESGETSKAAIIGFTITGGQKDSTWTYDGGIICHNASPLIKSNLIKGNGFVGYYKYGGGIICHNSSAIIEENIIDSNQFSFVQYSAGILSINSSPTISRNFIGYTWGGYVTMGGAGIVCDNSNAVIDHNLIMGDFNYDQLKRGGIYLKGSTADIVNNTIVRNQHGLICFDSSTATLINNIVYSNKHQNYGFSIRNWDSTNTISVSYSNIQGGWTGVGNIDTFPEFSDTAWVDFDFTLRSTSPCINTGDPNSPQDPDGTRTDIGAFYYHQVLTSIPRLEDYRNITIYPNPAKNKVTIKLSGVVSDGYSLLLYDAQGRIVLSKTKLISDTAVLEREALANGLYYLQLVSGDRIAASGKVVFE